MIARTTESFFAFTCLLLAFIPLIACETTKTIIPVDYSAREVVELARWSVESEEKVLGQVVKYEVRGASSSEQFFRVTDYAGRWVGQATSNGRFSRRTPFDGDLDLGIFSMNSGVKLLFEAKSSVRLKPVAVDADVQIQPKLQGKR